MYRILCGMVTSSTCGPAFVVAISKWWNLKSLLQEQQRQSHSEYGFDIEDQCTSWKQLLLSKLV